MSLSEKSQRPKLMLRNNKQPREQIEFLVHENFILAHQALEELRHLGYVRIVCPKCRMHPVVAVGDERILVHCECKYIAIEKGGEYY